MSRTAAHASAAAAASFVHRKPQSDLVSIVSFGSTALTQAQLSQSTIDADTALRDAHPTPSRGRRSGTRSSSRRPKLSTQTYPGRC
jgi:hypothetical protein